MTKSSARFSRALLTGGTSGIGLEIAKLISGRVDELLLPGRNPEKAARAATELRRDHPGLRVTTMELDLGSLQSVRDLCAKLNDDDLPIDLLILNAGIVTLGQRRPPRGSDGWPLVFETNYLGNFALIQGLLPLLKAGRARVVIQSSLAAAFGSVNWDVLIGQRKSTSLGAYQQSKIALELLGYELERRSREDAWGISVQLCHPGIVPGSGIAPAVRDSLPPRVVRWASDHLGNSPAQAARPALAAALTHSERMGMYAPGKFLGTYGPVVRREPFSPGAHARAAADLWERTESLVQGGRGR